MNPETQEACWEGVSTGGEDISRRDFLKMSTTALLGSLLPTKLTNTLSNLEEEIGFEKETHEVNIDELPVYFRGIINGAMESRVNSAGVVEVCESNNEIDFAPVPVIQTAINKNYLYLAKANPHYRCKETKGIVFHSFGASQHLLDTYMPHRSAKEYVENGFAQATSAMFLVGDEKFDSRKDLINSVPSIVQCELPSPEGCLVHSAHARDVGWDLQNTLYLARMNHVCNEFDLPNDISVLQTLHKVGENSAPNRSTIGIEITGLNFDKKEDFPLPGKISSVLTLATALTKRYKISPAFNFLGHRELDYRKSDPGRRLTYLMKVLVGLTCLTKKDKVLNEIVFGPFVDKTKTNDDGVAKYFNFITTYFRESSDATEAEEYLSEIKYLELMATVFGKEFV